MQHPTLLVISNTSIDLNDLIDDNPIGSLLCARPLLRLDSWKQVTAKFPQIDDSMGNN